MAYKAGLAVNVIGGQTYGKCVMYSTLTSLLGAKNIDFDDP